MATQYWVVNISPSVSETKYAIVRGTEAQAEAEPNAGGISGPYDTLAEAYNVYKNEPQNQNISPITLIGNALGAGTGYAVYGDSPSQVVGAAATGGNAANSAASGITGIWDKLNSRELWIRIAEGTLGIALIIVGLMKMTGATRVVDLPKAIAKTATK